MSINPRYKRTGTINPYQKHEFLLDASDTIFFANYFLGYFAHSRYASELMRLQKIEDLKKRKLWDNWKNPFKSEDTISIDKPFGIMFIVAVNPMTTGRNYLIIQNFYI